MDDQWSRSKSGETATNEPIVARRRRLREAPPPYFMPRHSPAVVFGRTVAVLAMGLVAGVFVERWIREKIAGKARRPSKFLDAAQGFLSRHRLYGR